MTAASPALAGSQQDRLANILLFVTPALFASNNLAAKIVADFFPPVALAVLRWGGVALLLIAFTWPELWRHRAHLKAKASHYITLGTLGMSICGALVYIGAQTTTATNISLIYAASPVVVIGLAYFFFDETPTPIQLGGTALAILGVLIIILKGDIATLLTLNFTIGDLYIVGTASSWALYTVLIKHWPSPLSTYARLAAVAVPGVIVLLPFLGWEIASLGFPPLDLRNAFTVIFLILVPGIAAYSAHGFVTRQIGASKSGLMLYLPPLYVVSYAWAFLGEKLYWHHWLGAAMVLPGIYIATQFGHRSPPSEEPA